MINLKRIIALSLCTVMFINGTASSVEAAIDNISSLSIGDTDSSSGQTSGNQDNKNTITWSTSDSIEVGSPFDKMNSVKGYDKDGNDITNLITVSGEVDTSKSGEYLLEYSVTDEKGETIKATRKVIVEDTKTQGVVNQNVTTEEVQSSEKTENNEEVKIVGSTFTRTYLSEPFDAKANITATDSNGKDITDLITVEGEVDTNKLGSYELKYSVTDETGKTATLTRKVNVINKNIFNKYIEKVNEETKEKTKELGFSIYLDNNTSKFLVENQSNDELDSTRKDEVVFKIRVIDKDNKEKLLVELLGSDTGDSEKLNSLKELEYSFGDYIEINTENAKERFDIVGEMSGDIKSKQDAETKDDESIKIEDYSDGVDNLDYLSNVRFKITEDGIETVYNNAPVISGLGVIEKALDSRDKQLEGVTVTDDHDGVISNDKIVITEEKDENDNVIALKYKVTDSWGRTTEATRIRKLIERTSETPNETPTTPETTLADNSISVKGIRFGTNSEYGDVDTRFKITFNDRSRKIYVINQDGRSMNSRIKDTYFKMVLYDSEGNEKRKVEINGDERSNTTKLDELKFQGWPYQYGDMISLWHYEAPVKIGIAGTVTQDDGRDKLDFTSGLTKKILEETRFELTAPGLKHTLNTAPVITFSEGESGLTIKRGEELDLTKDVKVTDDRDGVSYETSPFDSTKLGEQTVTYTATDNWGVKTTKARKVTVEPKNQIEAVSIKVKSKEGTPMFSIGFDEIKKQFVLNTQETNTQINESNKSIELTISVFNKSNVKKREFKIAGKDTVNSNSIQKFKNYKYEEGDYLQITPKTPSLVTINGEIAGKPSDLNYDTGVSNLDKWTNVRFQLIGGEFKYNYNEEPVISGHNNAITINRGQKFNILDGMSVIDATDSNEAIILTESNTTVTLKSGKDIFIGDQVYEIKYTDSWGRTSSVDRIVTINAKNPVERHKIELFDGDKTILSFAYDSIAKKFKALEYDKEYSFVSSEKENAFVIEFYENGKVDKQAEVVLSSEDLIDNKFLEKLEGVAIGENWYIKLWAYDFSKLRITSVNPIPENEPSEGNTPGDNTPESYTSSDDTVEDDALEGDVSNTDITFKDDDEMENTRFNISNEAITSIYNRAPVINGANNDSIVYGTSFDSMQGVTVDDEDQELNKAVIISGEVDTEKLGPQVLHYEVTDPFGRRATVERTVTVVPVYTINEVEYYNDASQKVFSIGINQSATGFTVKFPEPEVMPTATNSSKFEFKVFNSEEKEIYRLNIDSTTQINEELFDGLKELIIRPGYFFSVNGDDLSKIKITGRLDKDKQVGETDYANLTNSSSDYVKNVRFKLTENIVEVIYNAAPRIIVAEGKEDLTRNQAVTLQDYNLLEDLSIEDDKDTEEELTVDKIKITLPTDKNILTQDLDQAQDLIGKTVNITYQIADSWGRLSEIVTRRLTIESAMDDIKLKFLHAATSGADDMRPNHDRIALTISFNIEDGRLELNKGSENNFKGNTNQYGSIAILDKDNQVKLATVLGDFKNFEKEDPIFGQTTVNNYNSVDRFIRYVTEKKNELEENGERMIEYGDKLILRTYQSPFLYINGKVIDNQEDYSQGANLGSILQKSEFVVTPAGLKQIYTGPTFNSGNFTQLTIYNVIAGIQAVNMYLDTSNPNSLVLKAQELDTEYIDTKNHGNVFKIEIFDANGHIVKSQIHNGRTKPDALVRVYNNTAVEPGGYLTFKWYNDSKIKNTKLYNIRRQDNFPERVDYSGDITDPTYFNDVRFYFTTKGIVPTYNSAPTFTGIEDKSISLNDNFDKRDGVTVSDEIDDEIDDESLTYEVSGTVNTDRVGENTLTYSARDSWGRVGSYERKVYVKPKVHENHFEVYTKDNEKSFSIDFEPTLSNGADNGKLKITKFSDDPLDINKPTDKIFEVWIYGKNGEVKKNITLLGRDNSDSKNLDELNDFPYENGDYIKVWRAPNENSTNATIEGLKVTGNVGGDSFDFKDVAKGMEYMNNTVFYIKSTGLEANYNEAPVLKGVKDIVVYYGETNPNLLVNVTATDEEVVEPLRVTVTPNTIDTSKLGTTEITYSATDKWGRTTSQTANVTVRSKSYLNRFEIYGESTSRAEELKFSIGFNTDVNAFEFYNSDKVVSLDSIDLSTIPSDLNIILYSRFGREKLNVQLSSSDTTQQRIEELNKLKSVTVETFDMIEITTSNSSKVKLKGDVVGESNNNYQNGFNSLDQMRSIRFQVKNEGLTEVFGSISDNAVTFNGLDELTIKRGDDVNLLEGVTVTHPNEIITDITYSEFDELKVGTQSVTYYARDSWGNTFEKTRNVEVLPFNELEKVKITVSDTDKTNLINIKFDAIESTLSYELNKTSSFVSKLRKVLSFSKTIPNETNILKISTFNKDMVERESVSITKDDILNNTSKLDEINNVPFDEGGFIGIDVYNLSNDDALSIIGPVIYPRTEQNHNQDMRYIRYEINETGIRAHYNRAPQVTAKEVEHRISDNFDLNTVLTINDDYDSSDSMEVEFTEYDPYTVGKTEVTATVTDKWGLETKVQFDVYVLSYLDDSRITLKSYTNQELVTMSFDSKSGKLLVEFHRRNYGVPILSSTVLSETVDSIIKLNIYDDKQKPLKTIEFSGNDTIDTIKTKLEDFKDYNYHYNYFIGLEVAENAKSLIKIENVEKNDDKLQNVNYENGVENIDYFNNVRFQLNPYGLTAIYNEAPTLTRDSGDITAVKSINVDDYNLLSGVNISDDKDKLSSDDVKIKYNDLENSSALHLGENTITLIAKDKWGRESEAVTFNLNLKSAMDDLNITFLYADSGLVPNLDEKIAVLTFDMERNRILVQNQSSKDRFKFNGIQYGAFGVYNKNNQLVYKTILGDEQSFEATGSEFDGADRRGFFNAFKSSLEGIHIDYGYKIKIKIYQSPFVYINGNVINAQEEYSEGAYLSEILKESTFEITKEGLVQEYTKPESRPKNNDIVWLSGVAGDKLLNINVNPETQRLTVTNHSNEYLDTLYKDNSELFSIAVYDSQGNKSYWFDATTRKRPAEVVEALNNQPFEIGGYMTIKIHPTNRNRVRNMKIYGDIDTSPSRSLKDVDFSEEIKDVAYFNESKFYFTPNGLSLSYNDAPAFTGLTDVILLKGEQEEINLKQGVEVSDDNTEDIEYTIEYADGTEVSNPENYRPTTLGAQEVYYVATDNLRRKTREARFIWLQSASEISVKSNALLTVEEADPDLDTEEERIKYLIDLVNVYDEEDNESGKPIKVTEENIKGTFNPNIPDTYPITYKVQDSDGNITEATFNIQVVRTISVSVPIYVPFQLVTNLIKKASSEKSDPFVSGVMKVSNNYLTDVEVSVKELTKKEDTGGLEIVNPNKFDDWSALTEEQTMKYMALGIYSKSTFTNTSHTQNNPLWLQTNGNANKNSDVNSDASENSNSNANSNYIGRLPKATNLDTPNTGELSFTSKHGNKFIGGTTKGKFNLVLEFR